MLTRLALALAPRAGSAFSLATPRLAAPTLHTIRRSPHTSSDEARFSFQDARAWLGLGGDLSGEESDGEADDARATILAAALDAVPTHGWSKRALAAGAEAAGLSPAAAALVRRGEVDLVLSFVRSANDALEARVAAAADELADASTPADAAGLVLGWRLESVAPHASTWPQALAILARPAVVPAALTELARIADAAATSGWPPTTVAGRWYGRRAALAAAYTSLELSLIADFSPGHADTFASIPRRLADVGAAAAACGDLEGGVERAARWAEGKRADAATACGQGAGVERRE